MNHVPTLAIIGNGKMGRAIAAVAAEHDLTVSAMLGPDTPITRESLGGADVAIEFTEPRAAVANIAACLEARCPVVVGTTGWYDQLPAVTALVRETQGTLLWASNFSLGIYLMSQLVRYAGELAARVPSFDVHLVETHHTEKKDAPSGTAITLNQSIALGLGRSVPITSIRVGSVPGTHELILDGTYEQITVTHTARDRRVFAEGAVAAAQWLRGRTGMFTIADLFGAPDTQS